MNVSVGSHSLKNVSNIRMSYKIIGLFSHHVNYGCLQLLWIIIMVLELGSVSVTSFDLVLGGVSIAL